MKNTIIKVLSIVMAMVMALGTCIVVTGTAAAADCKHANYTQYGDPVAATCTTWGFTLYQCSDCGDHFKTEMNTLEKPHNQLDNFKWINEKTVAPTCVADGYTTKTCSICEKEEKYDFVSADEKYHDWNDGVKTDSTCTAEGVWTYTCKTCEATKTTAISEKGHKWVALEAQVVAPKCYAYTDINDPANTKAAYGMMPYKCSACGATREVEILPRGEHKFVLMDAVADTCEVIGHNAGYFCEWCLAPQNPLTDIINDATKHVWTEVAGTEKKAATCEENGFHTVYCANCKQTVVQTIPAYGHDFDHENPTIHVDPTCTTWGYDLFGCTKCGVKYENVPYEPIGHKWSESGVKVDPTCTTPGGIEYTCDNGCGEKKIEADADAPALGHGELEEVAAIAATCGYPTGTAGRTAGKKCKVCNEFVEGGIIIPALTCVKQTSICTVKGLKDVICSRCGYVYETGVSVTILPGAVESHVWVRTIASVDPTCTTAGTDVLACKYCGKTATQSVPALGHDADTTVVEATCMAPGYKLTVCKRDNCGAQLAHEILPVNPDGHIGEVVVNVDPTCESYGYQSGACVNCNKPYEKTIAKLGHKIVTVEAKAPTCTEDGRTAGSSCERCKVVFVESKKIDKLDHKEEDVAGVKATCTTDGLTPGKKCTRCGVETVKQTKIEKYNHYYNGVQYSETTVVTPSCKGAGKIGYVAHECYYCDEAYINSYSDVLEHFWGVKEHKDVNCVEDGYDYYECLNGCGEIKIDEASRIKAEGHKDKNGNVISTSCTRPEDMDIVCVNAFCPCATTCNSKGEVQIVHEDKFAEHVAGTCIVYEHDIFVCTVCGRKRVEDVKDKYDGHNWEVTSKTADPTYEKAQTVNEKCKVCGATQTRYVSKGIDMKVTLSDIKVDDGTVNGSKSVKATIAIRGDKAVFHNFFASFTYDANVLVYQSHVNANTIGDATVKLDTYKISDGKINITAITSNSAEGEVINTTLSGEYETFVTVNFKVKGSVHDMDKTGKTITTAVTLAMNGNVVDKDSKKLGVRLADAKNITLTIYKLGDVNDDGVVNNVDFVAISEKIKADAYDAQADIDGNGKVNEADLGTLQRIIIGRSAYADTAEARK